MSSLLDDENKYEKRRRQKRRQASLGALLLGVVAASVLLLFRWNSWTTTKTNTTPRVESYSGHEEKKHPIVEDLINKRLDELMLQQQFEHLPIKEDAFEDENLAQQAAERFKEQVERARKIQQEEASSADGQNDIPRTHRHILPERGNLPHHHIH